MRGRPTKRDVRGRKRLIERAIRRPTPTELATPAAPSALLDVRPFVGRVAELAALRDHLDRGARLVTIVGTFGVGKTRLARRLASQRAQAGARLWLCDLAAGTRDRDLPIELARALGVSLAPELGVAAAIDRLGRTMAACGAGAMFVLDNVDPVVEHVAAALVAWLAAADQATFVVTCRQALGLADELRMHLSPLSEHDGAALFHERMLAVRGATPIAGADQACVVEIVRKLDGIPLAIEMAAARTAVLRPVEILQRLSARFELLRNERRDAPPRHATLGLAIDWSWDALNPWERAALGQCAVFPGSFTVAAAEATIELRDHADAPPVLDVLQRLVDRSLMYAAPTVEDGERARIGLHESVREYAAGRLDPEAFRAASARHARYFLDWAEPLAETLEREAPGPALTQIGREFGNLAIIVHRGESAPEAACRAALVLDALLARRGPLALRSQLLATSAATASSLEPRLRIRLLHAYAHAEAECGRPFAALERLDQALELARGDPASEGPLLMTMLELDYGCGRFDRAEAQQREIARIARATGDELLLASALLGSPLRWHDSTLAEVMGPVLQVERAHTRVRLLYHVGLRALFHGEPHEALAAFEEARQAARGSEDIPGELHMRWLAGASRHALGELAEAAAIYDEVVARLEETGHRRRLGLVLALSGCLRFSEWRLAEARALLERSRAIAHETSELYAEGLALAGLAALEALAGRLSLADLLLATARAIAASIDAAGVSMTLGAGVELLAGVVDLGRGRAAAEQNDPARALEHRTRAERQLARSPGSRHGGSYHAISLGRILERALVEERVAPLAPAILPRHTPANVEVAADGGWFRVQADEPVELGRHIVLRRLLIALAGHRVALPGHPLPASHLIATAWPDERIEAKAALNRLHNAIAVLRAKGLRGVLRTTDEGYLLDSSVTVVKAELTQAAAL